MEKVALYYLQTDKNLWKESSSQRDQIDTFRQNTQNQLIEQQNDLSIQLSALHKRLQPPLLPDITIMESLLSQKER
ncbi:hypothetical protein [Seinonella peptonophila]|nr:hypothetical protein [Seinonella peptonophila]